MFDTFCSLCVFSIDSWTLVSFTVFVYQSLKASLPLSCVYSGGRCDGYAYLEHYPVKEMSPLYPK